MQSASGASSDTIVAIATAPGRGAIGVVRLSGPAVRPIAMAVVGDLPRPRHAALCVARNSAAETLDEGIALFFPAPHSYTGEDVLEFQGHGGPVVLQSVLAAFVDAGARLAEPGEFTRRAFLEGKIDLAQAEAVADLIDAASREAARCALRSLSGEFSDEIRKLVQELVSLRALIEASLDFPEEEIDSIDRLKARDRLAGIHAGLQEVFARSRQGSLLRAGVTAVIAGRPNVGKSSLLNRLTGDERAIVTPLPGTTRDTLRETIQIEGIPFTIVDTAGLRESGDEIEALGIERTWRELARTDVVIAVFDARAGIGAEDRAILDRLPADARRINVFNKIDLVQGAGRGSRGEAGGDVRVSAMTGAGLDDLRGALLEAAGWQSAGETPYLARERHLSALAEAQARVQAAVSQTEHWEFVAEELRLAQASLSRITGEFSADDLLGEIFTRFCIGK